MYCFVIERYVGVPSTLTCLKKKREKVKTVKHGALNYDILVFWKGCSKPWSNIRQFIANISLTGNKSMTLNRIRFIPDTKSQCKGRNLFSLNSFSIAENITNLECKFSVLLDLHVNILIVWS